MVRKERKMPKFVTCFVGVLCLMTVGTVPPSHALSFLDDKLTISGFLKNETWVNELLGILAVMRAAKNKK